MVFSGDATFASAVEPYDGRREMGEHMVRKRLAAFGRHTAGL